MTTFFPNYEHSLYSTSINDMYNGVLKVSNGESYGTGTILYDGKSIITAAHLFDGLSYTDKEIKFFDGNRNFTLNAQIDVFPFYDDYNLNGDLAILTFEDTLDSLYSRYNLFRDKSNLYQDYTAVGYGNVGSGNLGIIDEDEIYKLKTTNTFDTNFNALLDRADISINWDPLDDSILIADFDNGNESTDLIGYLLEEENLGTGITEGLIAPGDSGGPAFIENKIVGVASYTTKLDIKNSSVGDINNTLDSSFGEIAAYQSTLYYEEWIDKTIRSNYKDAPTADAEVKSIVNETDEYAYFLLSFIPDRNIINDIITLDFKTIDGTAIAGKDYIHIEGQINLYKDESSVVIAVEIIEDNINEFDEYFYLEVSNPNYGGFGEGVDSLIAKKTITEDLILF